MSDPLSVSASVIAVLQLAGTVTQYIKDVKEGAKDRTHLRDELRSLTSLLEMVLDRVEDMEGSGNDVKLEPPSFATVGAPDGPVQRFKAVLEEIVGKVVPKGAVGRLTQPLKWPFDKKDITQLLSTLERIKTHLTLVLQNDLIGLAKMSNNMLDLISKQVRDLDTAKRDDEVEKILLWISPASFQSKQADMLEGVQPGTGSWFLEDAVFRSWMEGQVDVLWCPGIPGAGKTRLVSLVVDLLDSNCVHNRSPFAFVYCDYHQQANQTPLRIISSLLQQVLRRMGTGNLPAEVFSLYALHKKHDTRPKLTQLTEIFRKVSSPFTSIPIVIDALDECASSETSALEVIDAIRALGSNIRLLCTSRLSTTLESFFSEAKRIDILARDEDLRVFLEARIGRQSRLSRHIQADPTLLNEILTTIIGESHGMFLLPALHFESLSLKISRREVRSALKTLPQTLDATYEQAMHRIQKQAEGDVNIAETVIFWILCARRPLTVYELQHMYGVRLLLAEESVSVGLEDDDLPDDQILTSVCGGLITVDGESKVARLVHYTAQQYLLRAYSDRLTGVRVDLTRISLAYLQLPNFSTGVATSDTAMAQRLLAYPFLDYAAKHWGSDLGTADLDVLWDPLRGFLSKNNMALDVTSQVQSLPQHRFEQWSQEYPRHVPSLVLAASFELPSVLERLVHNNEDIEGKGSDGETAIIRSAGLGHAMNVTTLIKLGAAVNATDVAGETALERAASMGKVASVKALLDGGADVGINSTSGWTVLMSAVSSGNIEVVRLLVEAGADLFPQTVWGDSALSLATLNCQEAIASYLSESGAVLPLNAAGRRASVIASRKGLQTLVRRLTTGYKALLDIGLHREEAADTTHLAFIAEVNETDITADSSPGTAPVSLSTPDEELVGVDEILWGLPYTRGFHRRYDIGEKIGEGHFAKVFVCTNKITGLRYAAKVIQAPRSLTNGKRREDMGTTIRLEIKALRELSHPRIIGLIDVVVTDEMDQLCLLLELGQQELFYYIVDNQKLSEQTTRTIFGQLFSALSFMHQQGWVHRDVKPENILIDPTRLTIKLTDFGLAVKLADTSGTSTELCGTPSYVAPEVLVTASERRYSYAIDTWSAGVVLYICLCGFPPFSDELYSTEFPYTLSEQIKSGRFDYPSPYWDPVGDTALDLIDSMLVVDPEKRHSTELCLQHAWFTEDS